MRSENEIFAIVCRIISENAVGTPSVSAETKFSDLKYLYKPLPNYSEEQSKVIEEILLNRPSAYNFGQVILQEFSRDANHPWFYPDYFSYEKNLSEIETVQELCKIIKDGYERLEKQKIKEKTKKEQILKMKDQLKNVNLIDLDQLLYGEATFPEVQKYFLEGEFDEEQYLVQAIKTHLLTSEQTKLLSGSKLSIRDILNGRYGDDVMGVVNKIYNEWNDKLNFHKFGE